MKIKMHIQKDGADGTYIVSYTGNKFKKLEHKSGKISEKQFKALMQVVPPLVSAIEAYRQKYGRVIYEDIVPVSNSIFKTLLDIYHHWYLQQTGIAPRIDATSGMQLNKIISYLKKQTSDETEIEFIFQQIFEKWSTLPDFYQNQREIRQINSNLNIILNHLKNGNSDSKSQARTVSDDLRQSL